MDVFIGAHLVGWFFKALIIWNNLIVWTMSILFEIYEKTFRHWLTNFYECWWDHLFLDLLGCNLLGILLGNYVMKKFKVEKFHWFFMPTDKSEQMSYLGRFWYSLTEVKPYVDKLQWHFLASFKNFIIVLWLILLMTIVDLSNFFNKKMIGLPANHWLLAIRIWVMGFYSILVASDFYRYSRQPDGHRKASFNMYLAHFIILVEVLLFWRNFESELISQIFRDWNSLSC